MNLADFTPGERIILTSRTKHGEERRVAYVEAVDYRGNGMVTYNGISCDRGGGDRLLLPAGAGAFDPTELGSKPFGLVVAVEKA